MISRGTISTRIIPILKSFNVLEYFKTNYDGFKHFYENTEEDNSCVYAVLNLEKTITTEINFLDNIEYLGNRIFPSRPKVHINTALERRNCT